ncbi:hypothetical protein AL387_gp052 [Salmon gill poxvirus]|uniref:Uncharacterized protein n=1 Tax=Salmon gill poxvirus TaxID=1680908 RepID=A0A0H4XWI6_9POXV|nr:hypothetical protein AL387_gp052 [Salmon gill poxvirus]AKR04176.1 hypothetical protein SGPV052 [Salmon gill poxvirus]
MTNVYVLIGKAPWVISQGTVKMFRTEQKDLLQYNPDSDTILKLFPFFSKDSVFPYNSSGIPDVNFSWELGNILNENIKGGTIIIDISTTMPVSPKLSTYPWNIVLNGLKKVSETQENWNLSGILIFDNDIINYPNLKPLCNTMIQDFTKLYPGTKTQNLNISVFSNSGTESTVKEDGMTLFRMNRLPGNPYYTTELISDFTKYFKLIHNVDKIKNSPMFDNFLIGSVAGISTFLFFLLLFFVGMGCKLAFNK